MSMPVLERSPGQTAAAQSVIVLGKLVERSAIADIEQAETPVDGHRTSALGKPTVLSGEVPQHWWP